MTSISAPAKGILITLLTLSVGLVIAALIVVSLRPTPPLSDPSTPTGVVQRYVLAFQSSDLATAQEYVQNGSDKQVCDPTAVADPTAQLKVVRETTTQDTATLTVEFDYGSDGLMSLENYSYRDVFELRKISGSWMITAMPWTLGLCTEDELGY